MNQAEIWIQQFNAIPLPLVILLYNIPKHFIFFFFFLPQQC